MQQTPAQTDLSDAQSYAGIDIGGTSIKYTIMRDGRTEDSRAVPTKAAEGPAAVTAQVAEIIRSLQAEAPDLCAVGIGVPGVVDPTTDLIIQAPNLSGWTDVPLKRELQAAVNIPIFVQNDANVAALAELHAGAGSDLRNMLYITLGTGVGAAIILERKLITGDRGGTGEIGYTIIRADVETAGDGQPRWRAGTLEEFTGRRGILDRARALGFVPTDDKADFDVRDLSTAAAAGDAIALRCLREVGAVLGIGLASAMNLLGISRAVIGGGISQVHGALLEAARAALRTRALPSIAREAELRIAAFGAAAGVLGAAWLAHDRNSEISSGS